MKHYLIYQNTSTCVYNRKKRERKKRLCIVHPSHVEWLNSEDNLAPNGVILARMRLLINLLVLNKVSPCNCTLSAHTTPHMEHAQASILLSANKSMCITQK